MKQREIQNKNGKFIVLVDDDDFDLIDGYLRVQRKKANYFLVYTEVFGFRSPLGRAILERIHKRQLLPTEFTDHIDRNPFNNCRANLRIASRAENNRNQGKRTGRAYQSSYKGVRKNGSGWSADIQVDDRRFHLGTFITEAEAKAAYVGASIVAHGEFSCSR